MARSASERHAQKPAAAGPDSAHAKDPALLALVEKPLWLILDIKPSCQKTKRHRRRKARLYRNMLKTKVLNIKSHSKKRWNSLFIINTFNFRSRSCLYYAKFCRFFRRFFGQQQARAA